MKVTTELKEKLNLIRTELEDELVREKVVIEECEGVELNALDEGGVSLLFQNPENYDPVTGMESTFTGRKLKVCEEKNLGHCISFWTF